MDDTNTLEELESSAWGEPPLDLEYMHRVKRIRSTPLRDITDADLRFMLILRQSPYHLLPLALTALQAKPFLEAEYFPGDLLQASLEQDPEFYTSQPQVTAFLLSIAKQAEKGLPLVPIDDFQEVSEILKTRIEHFCRAFGNVE
jgi:hypothetical protein